MTAETGTGRPAVEDGTTRHTSPARARLQLVVVGTAAMCCSLSQSLLIPVQTTMQADLRADPSTFGWLFTATLLVAAVAVPVLGRLGDMFGKRLMLLVAVGMLTVGSSVCASTDNIAAMIAGRAIQGFAIAAIPLGISLLSALLPPERVATGIAVVSAMLGVGGALAMPLGGYVGEHADYHWLFRITMIAGALSFTAILFMVPEAPGRTRGRVDIAGTVILSAALVCLLLPLTKSSDWGWLDGRTLGSLGGAAALFAVLVVVQKRVRNPLIDLVALRRKPIVLTNLASALFGFALFAMFLGTPLYLQAPEATGYGFGLGVVASGVCMLPGGLMMLFLSGISARIIRTTGPSYALTAAGLVVALGWLTRLFFSDHLWQVVAGCTVIGTGVALGFAAMPSLINTHTPNTEIAAANGINSLARSLGLSISSAVTSSILAGYTLSGPLAGIPRQGAYHAVFIACGAAALVAAALALAIPEDS